MERRHPVAHRRVNPRLAFPSYNTHPPPAPPVPHQVPTAISCPGPVAYLAAIVRVVVGGFRDQIGVALPPGELLEAIWRRVQRLAAQLLWLGATDPPGPARPAAATTPGAPTETAEEVAAKPPMGPPAPRADRTPDPLTLCRAAHQHGWLICMLPNLHTAADAFEQFLLGPGPDRLMAADPRYAGLLHRLGWMLGVNPDLLPPPLLPEPPPGPLAPTDLRPAPPGYPRTLRVNQLAYEMLEARQRADAERALDLAAKNA